MKDPQGRNQNESLQNDLVSTKANQAPFQEQDNKHYTDIDKVGKMNKEQGVVFMKGELKLNQNHTSFARYD